MTTHLGVIIGLALRNLRRHLRRTLLTAAAMVVGSMLLIFSLSLGDGSHESWIDSGVRMGSGHVTVESPAFRMTQSIDARLSTAARQVAEQALQNPLLSDDVSAVTSRMIVTGLASSAAGARPVQIMGVDPLSEAAFTTLNAQVVEGRYLEPDDRLAAFVGKQLVDSLDLRLGSRLVLNAQDVHNDIGGQLVRVVGIFQSGVPEIDQSIVHIPLSTAGEFLGSGDDVTTVGVLVSDSAAVPRVAQALQQALAGPVAAEHVTVLDWREAMPELAAAVALDDFGNYLVFAILFIIIGFGIVNTVVMSVLHRHREFGVLQALGLTPGQTGTVVLVEGLVMTAVSGLVGVALGIWGTWYFFGDGLDFTNLMGEEMTFSGVVIDPVIVPLLRVTRVVHVLLFILSIGAVSSVYPAIRAASIDVPTAMKFER